MVNAVYGRIVASALTLGVALVAAAGLPGVVPDASPDVAKADRAAEDPFRTSDRCLACHKGVTTSRGLDVSIGYDWRGSMMANSARGVMKISTENLEQNAGLTEPVRGGGVAGQPYETIESLQGVVQLDKLDDKHALIVTQQENAPLALHAIALP